MRCPAIHAKGGHDGVPRRTRPSPRRPPRPERKPGDRRPNLRRARRQRLAAGRVGANERSPTAGRPRGDERPRPRAAPSCPASHPSPAASEWRALYVSPPACVALRPSANPHSFPEPPSRARCLVPRKRHPARTSDYSTGIVGPGPITEREGATRNRNGGAAATQVAHGEKRTRMASRRDELNAYIWAERIGSGRRDRSHSHHNGKGAGQETGRHPRCHPSRS